MTDEDEWRKLPTFQKVLHKSWKARAEGYKECIKDFATFDDNDPEFNKYLGHIKKFVTDSNELNRIQGVQAALVYIENAKVAGKTCSEVIGGVISKCFNSKPRLRELGINICLMYIEINKNELAQEEITKGFENKQPKVVHACMDVITIALREFGSKVISVKPLFKQTMKLLDHKDKNVRESAKSLFVEVYRWIGGAVRTPLQAINTTVLKELEEEWEKIGQGGSAQQTRFMRSQQNLKQKMEKQAMKQENGSNSTECAAETVQEIDPYDLIDPVEILSKLPKDFFEKIEAKKWQERKEMLEIVDKLSQNPKLVEGDYGDLVKALKRVVSKDSNIMLVTIAIKCLGALAAGLRKKFHPFALVCLESMFDRFKEKKVTVLTALQEATDSIFLTTNAQLISETCVEFLENKNPSIRAQVGFFLARSFAKTKSTLFKKPLMKMYIQALLKNVDHSDPAVRDASYKAIGMMMKLVGDAKMNPFIADLDKLKLDKINESAGKCEVVSTKTEPSKTSAPAPSALAKPKPPSSKGKLILKKGSAKEDKKKPSGKKSSSPASAPIELEMSDDVAEEKVAMVISNEERNQITNSNWKERYAGLQSTYRHLQLQEPKEFACQAFVKILSFKPGWKDTNFNCLNEKFKIVQFLAQNGVFTQTSANVCLIPITDKIGDIKCGVEAKNALSEISDACGLAWVATRVLDHAMSQKNPKTQGEALVWLNTCVKEFGITGLNLKLVIEKIKLALAASNPVVRTAGLTIIGTLSMYIGDQIHMFFDSETSAMLKQIEAEIEKVKGQSPPAPSRKSKKSSTSSAVVGSEKEEIVEEKINLEDLVSRVDISGEISEGLISKIGDKNWKERKEGLENVLQILSDAKFVDPNLGELPVALKSRLSDSNKILITTTLNILAQLAESLGPHCKKHLSVLCASVINCLSDSKPQVRQTALKCMDAWFSKTSLSLWLEGETISTCLSNPKHTFLRIELLNWLTEKLLLTVKLPTTAKEALALCVPVLYQCCEDRSGDVRAKAQASLSSFIKHLSYEKMLRMTGKLSASSKSAIMTMLEKAKEQIPELPSKNNAPKPTPATTCKPAPASKKSDDQEDKDISPEKEVESKSEKTEKPEKERKIAPKTLKLKSAAKEEEVVNLFINIPNGKLQRKKDEFKLKTLKWSFVTPRENLVQQLQQQLSFCVSPSLLALLFHKDFQNHLKAVSQITQALKTEFEAMISCLDILLRWFTLRFYDKNTTVHIKSLEFVMALFDMLVTMDYRMTEYEMASFLPHLITKIGENKPKIKNMVHAILKKSTLMYPSSKLYAYVMEGVKSKNSRQRQECLLHISILIQSSGIGVCQPNAAKAVKELATYIGDRDKEVRTAALDAIVAAFNVSGDVVLKQVGKLNEKDMSMLQERIKRTGKLTEMPKTSEPQTPIPKISSNQPIKSVTTSSNSVMTSLCMASSNPVVTSSGITSSDDSSANISDGIGISKVACEYSEVVITPFQQETLDYYSKIIDQEEIDELITKISVVSIAISLDSLKEIRAKLDDTENADLLQGKVDKLISSCAIKVRMILDWYLPSIAKGEKAPKDDLNISMTDFKFLVNDLFGLLYEVCTRRALISETTCPELYNLLTLLNKLLISSSLEQLEFGPEVIDMLNRIFSKLTDNCDATAIYCTTLMLLQQTNEMSNPKYRANVEKCLWKNMRLVMKLIKGGPEAKKNLKLSLILVEMEKFLTTYPTTHPMYSDLNRSVNWVSICIQKLSANYGVKIMDEIGLIKNPSESLVVQLIKKELGPLIPNNENTVEEVEKENLTPEDIDDKLTKIFLKITSSTLRNIGLNELHSLKKAHSSAELDKKIDSRIAAVNVASFANYVQQGLLRVERGTCKPVEQDPAPVDVNKLVTKYNKIREGYGMTPIDVNVENNNNENKASSSIHASRQLEGPKNWAEIRKKYNRKLGRDDTTFNNENKASSSVPVSRLQKVPKDWADMQKKYNH